MPIVLLSGTPSWFETNNINSIVKNHERYFAANIIFPEDESIWSGAFFVGSEAEGDIINNDVIKVHFMPNAPIEKYIKSKQWFYISKGPVKIGKFKIDTVEIMPDDWTPKL